MKKRSGDLHQHDADDDDDEGTLWRKDTECVFMCKDECKGLDENTPAAMLGCGKVSGNQSALCCTYCSQSRCFVKIWTFTMNTITEL